MEKMSRIEKFKHRYQSWSIPFLRKKSQAKEDRFHEALKKCTAAAAREFKGVKKEVRRLDDIRLLVGMMVRDAEGVTFPDSLSAEVYAEQIKARDDAKKRIVEFAQEFKNQLDALSEEVSAKYEELKEFKIVLFGCTKAGKSTLREALTMGNGSTIGKGGQSTTKKVTRYTWDGLCLYDTPGVDSSKDLDRSETKAALAEMRNADLAVFVMMPAKISGSEELRYLKQVIACGHDVLVLLNVKESLNPFEDFEAMGNEHLISDEGQKENIESIREGVGDEKLAVQVIHAQAGYLACAPDSSEMARNFFACNDVTRKKLLAISRFDEMKTRIENLVLNDGIRLRVKGVRLKFIDSLDTFCEEHHADFADLKMACEKAEKELLQIRERINSVVKEYADNATRDLMFESGQAIDIDSFVERCFNEKWDKDRLGREWKSYLKDKLENIAERSLQKQISKIKKYMDELQLRLGNIVESVGKLDFAANGVNWKSMFAKGAGFLSVVCVLHLCLQR